MPRWSGDLAAIAGAPAILVCALALAACGLAAGPSAGNISLTVTRSFGAVPVGFAERSRAPGSETALRMLEGTFRVKTRSGGGSIEAIDGQAANSPRLQWSYYVNGIEGSVGALSTAVHRGDSVWWDLHDRSATGSVPAVVGSFPEPFLHGIGGKRLPTTLECAPDAAKACARVAASLGAVDVPASSQLLGTGSGQDTLSVVVGTWSELKPELVADLIDHGPSASGVYARFTGPGGNALQLLDEHSRLVRTLGAGAGLIATTADPGSVPTWLVTGTDSAGVTAAAAAFSKARLHDHYALAVQGSRDLPVPATAPDPASGSGRGSTRSRALARPR